MSDASRSREPRPSAVPAGNRPHRRKWLLPLLLGLVLLIALLLLLSQCGDDDDDTASTSSTPTTAATTATAQASASADPTASATASAGAGLAGGAAGTVTAGGANLLGAADLSTYTGQSAVGRAAKVQSVPSDEGFWVGTGEQDRIWIQLTGTGGESDYKVKQGDGIDFTGTVAKAAEGFADTVGLTEAEGAAQLTEQGYYVSVPSSSVKLSE